MARLITTGFEFQNGNLDGVALGSWTYDATAGRTGGTAITTTVTGNATLSFIQVASLTQVYARAYIKVTNLPASNGTGMVDILSGLNTLVRTFLQSDGSVRFTDSTGRSDGTGTTLAQTPAGLVGAGEWHSFEVSAMIDSSTTTDHAAFRLDGASYYDAAVNLSNLLPDNVVVRGLDTTTGTAYLDDVAVNDSLGGNQNSWPGPGVVILMTPISDNAVGTGWTLGTGTAISSNGFDAVNNKPPLGKADLAAGTDAWQIRNASSNANVDYKGNTATYLAAGLGLRDTVTLAQAIIITGAPSGTSAKSGNLGATNPTITLATIGTFYDGANIAATYPTGWKSTRSAIQYAPSVTIGNAAVLDVQQVTASTRIAMVCFLGMVVEYVPALPPELMGHPFGLRGQQQMNQLLAQ